MKYFLLLFLSSDIIPPKIRGSIRYDKINPVVSKIPVPKLGYEYWDVAKVKYRIFLGFTAPIA